MRYIQARNAYDTCFVQMLLGCTVWRIVAGLMASWVFVLLLMSSSLYQLALNTDMMQNLSDVRMENEALKKEIEEHWWDCFES